MAFQIKIFKDFHELSAFKGTKQEVLKMVKDWVRKALMELFFAYDKLSKEIKYLMNCLDKVTDDVLKPFNQLKKDGISLDLHPKLMQLKNSIDLEISACQELSDKTKQLIFSNESVIRMSIRYLVIIQH